MLEAIKAKRKSDFLINIDGHTNNPNTTETKNPERHPVPPSVHREVQLLRKHEQKGDKQTIENRSKTARTCEL